MNKTRFFEPPTYNLDGRQQLWIDACIQTHDTWCGCNYPTAHLLNCLLPPGHQDRNLTVEELIEKAYQQKWPSGGKEEKGGTTEENPDTKEGDLTIEDLEDAFGDGAIEDLLAAAAADEQPR